MTLERTGISGLANNLSLYSVNSIAPLTPRALQAASDAAVDQDEAKVSVHSEN